MPNPVVAAIDHAPIPGTTKKALIDARIGQGKFRLDLFDLWNARCCVTGLNIPSLLRASHIRPWSESTMRSVSIRSMDYCYRRPMTQRSMQGY
jgi:hypothetical protein